MAQVVSLKILSVTNIITQIWNNKVCLPKFIDYCRKMSLRKPFIAGELLNIEKGHHEQMENIFKQIMDLSLPQKTKLRICLAMINLERDAYTFFEVALSILNNKKDETVIFIMSKLCFTSSGRVNPSRSIMKSILDSYGTIEIDYQKLRSCFVWNEAMLNEYKNQHKYNSTKKIREIISILEDRSNRVDPKDIPILHRLDRTLFLSRMLIHLIFSADSCKTYNQRFKIILAYERLPQEISINIIKVYGNLLVYKFLYSEQIDYCKHFYQQVCLYAPQYCKEILQAAFNKVIFYDFVGSSTHNTHIFELVKLETFFYIWFETPADVKNKFIINNIHSSFNIKSIIFGLDNYEKISLILKDSALSKENQMYLIDFLTVSYKCNPDYKEHAIVLDKLIKEFRNGSDYVAVDTVKLILEKRFGYLHDKIELAITSNEDLVQLKTLVRDDINFVSNVVKYHIDCNFLLSVTEDALKWKYGDNKPELLNYITETFIHTDEFINVLILLQDEIKDWKEEVYLYCEYIINIFREPSVTQAMKNKLHTTDLFREYLRKLITVNTDEMNKRNPYRREHQPYFISDLLTRVEIKQKIKSYLMSETGLKDVIQAHIYTDHSHIETVKRSRIIESHRTYIMIRTFWLKAYHLHNAFYKYFVENAKDVFNKHFKPPNIETLLPHQSLEQYKTIVNAFYKLFMLVMSGRNPEPFYERDLYPLQAGDDLFDRDLNQEPWKFLEDPDLSVWTVICFLAKMNHVPALID